MASKTVATGLSKAVVRFLDPNGNVIGRHTSKPMPGPEAVQYAYRMQQIYYNHTVSVKDHRVTTRA